MKSRYHDDAMAELYRDDPALALEVINDILADGDPVSYTHLDVYKRQDDFITELRVDRGHALDQERFNAIVEWIVGRVSKP